MKYPKVINYYLSIISSWDLELISCLMDQSSRQTCKQKLIVMMTSTYKYCVLPEKKLMFIPSPMEEIYTSPLPSPPLPSPVEIPNLLHTLLFKILFKTHPLPPAISNPLKGNIGIFYNFASKFLALQKKSLPLCRSLFYSGPKQGCWLTIGSIIVWSLVFKLLMLRTQYNLFSELQSWKA